MEKFKIEYSNQKVVTMEEIENFLFEFDCPHKNEPGCTHTEVECTICKIIHYGISISPLED